MLRALAAAAALPALLAAAPAWAGQFTLHSCTLPDGSAASMSGWTYGDGGDPRNVFEGEGDRCASGTANYGRGFGAAAGLRTETPGTVESGWRYRAPGDTIVRGGLVRWSGFLSGSNAYESAAAIVLEEAAAGAGSREVRRYAQANTNEETAWGGGSAGFRGDGAIADRQPVDGDVRHHGFAVLARCTSPGGVNDECNATYYARGVSLVVSDEGAPTGGASGELVSDGQQRGVRSVRVTAADGGAGVLDTRLLLDGAVVATARLEGAGDVCRDAVAGNADPYEYAGGGRPCPASGAATLSLDTTRIPDGSHHLKVAVVDAAGNEVSVAERAITVVNAGPVGGPGSRPGVPACFVGPGGALFNPLGSTGPVAPNGTDATAEAVVSGRALVKRGRATRGVLRRTIGYTARQRFGGHLLTRAGRPIAGASIFLLVTPENGAPTLCGAPVVTSRTGRWSTVLPARGTNRRVAAVYFPSSRSDTAVVAPAATLGVRASAGLRVTPPRVRRGRTVRFDARLRGAGRIGSVLAYLQARERGSRRWRTFQAVRSDGEGRLRARYRFTRARRTTFTFRLRIPRQRGRPYATGSSSQVSVRVR